MPLSSKLNRWASRLSPPTAVPPGVYPFSRQADGQQTRFHLRVDRDGSGLLLANATVAARLNPTGALIACRLLSGDDPPTAARALQRTFRHVTPADAAQDVARVGDLITRLAEPGDNYPILNLGDPASGAAPCPERPLSADLMTGSPEQMDAVLAGLWNAGIPHATFHLLEGMPAEWIIRAVERAEDLGMIAGVRGRATDLAAPGLLREIAMAGVDHVNLYVLSPEPAMHDRQFGDGDLASARRVFDELRTCEVYPVAEVPLLAKTYAGIDETAEFLTALGLESIAFYAVATDGPTADDEEAMSPAAVVQAAAIVEESSDDWSVRSLWYPPLRRVLSAALRSQLRAGPPSSGDHSVRVAPNGLVCAPRGSCRPAGNIVRDDWTAIRSHSAYAEYLDRLEQPTRCGDCPGLAVCTPLCPQSPAGWVERWPASGLNVSGDAV